MPLGTVRPSRLASTLKRALKYEQTAGGAGRLELDAELLGQEEEDHHQLLLEGRKEPAEAAGLGGLIPDRPFLHTRPSSALERQRIHTDQSRRAKRRAQVEYWSTDEMWHILMTHPYLATVIVCPPIEEEDGVISRVAQPLPDALRAHQIDGMSLLELSAGDIKECFGVKQVGVIKGIIRHIAQLLDPDLDLTTFIDETLSLQPAEPASSSSLLDYQATGNGSSPATRPSSAAVNLRLMAAGGQQQRPGSAISSVGGGGGERPSSASTVAAKPSALPSPGNPTHASSLNPFPHWEQEHEALLGNWGGAGGGGLGSSSRPSSGKDANRHLPATGKSLAQPTAVAMTGAVSANVSSAAESTRKANAELLALLDGVGELEADPQQWQVVVQDPSVACQTMDEAELFALLKPTKQQLPSRGLMEREKRYTMITDLYEILQAGLSEGMQLGWLINVAYYNLPEAQRSLPIEEGGVGELADCLGVCGAKVKQQRRERRAAKKAERRADRDKERVKQGLPLKDRRKKKGGGALRSVSSFVKSGDAESGGGVGSGDADGPKKKRERTARFIATEPEHDKPHTNPQEAATDEEDEGSSEEEEDARSKEGSNHNATDGRKLHFDKVPVVAVDDEDVVVDDGSALALPTNQSGNKTGAVISGALLERYAAMVLSLDEYRDTLFDLTDALDIPSFDHFATSMSEQHGKAKIEAVRRRTALSMVFSRCAQDDYGVMSKDFMLAVVLEYCGKCRREARGLQPRSTEEWLELFDVAGGFFLAADKPRRRKNRSGASSVSGSEVAPSSNTGGGLPRQRSTLSTASDRHGGLSLLPHTAGQGGEEEDGVWDTMQFVSFTYEEFRGDTAEDFDTHVLWLKTIVEMKASAELGFDKLQISSEEMVQDFMPKTHRTRPLVVCYSSVVDPSVLVENTFRSCRETASSAAAVGRGLSSRPSSGARGRRSSSRPSSAKLSSTPAATTPGTTSVVDGSVIAPSVRQKKLLVFSVASAESEDFALRSIEREGIALGSWIYVSFPRNSIDKPFLPLDQDQEEEMMGDASESVSVWSGSGTDMSMSTTMSGPGGVSLTGKMNEFLRKVARLLTTRQAALVHDRFRLFCHCPLDFIDANNVPTLCRSVCVFVPLLQEKTRQSIPHALLAVSPSPVPRERKEDEGTPVPPPGPTPAPALDDENGTPTKQLFLAHDQLENQSPASEASAEVVVVAPPAVAPLPDIDGTLAAVPLSPQKIRSSPQNSPQRRGSSPQRMKKVEMEDGTDRTRPPSPLLSSLHLLAEVVQPHAATCPILTFILSSLTGGAMVSAEGDTEKEKKEKTAEEESTSPAITPGTSTTQRKRLPLSLVLLTKSARGQVASAAQGGPSEKVKVGDGLAAVFPVLNFILELLKEEEDEVEEGGPDDVKVANAEDSTPKLPPLANPSLDLMRQSLATWDSSAVEESFPLLYLLCKCQ